MSHCAGSHQYDPSEWYASLSDTRALRLGAGRTVALRRSSLGHFPRPPLPPAPLRRDCSAPLPTGTPPTLFVFVWLGFLPGFRLGCLRPVRLRPSMLRLLLFRGVPQGRCRLRRLPLRGTRLRLYALRSGALRLDRVQVFPSSLPPVLVRLGAVRAQGQKKVAGVRPGDLGVTNSSTLPLSYSASYKFSLRCSCVSVICPMVPMPFVRLGPRLL